MATYAAVVSVMHLMEQIQSYQARHSIFYDSQQRQLESLGEKVSFLQDFLETYSYRDSNEAESLENRIVDAANAAEDAIESYIVDDIHGRLRKIQSEENETNVNLGRSTVTRTNITANNFSHDVQRVIDSIDCIIRELVEFKDKSRVRKDPQSKESGRAGSKYNNTGNDTVVGFDDILNSIMEKLTVKQSNLQVVAITGMGGAGKSTLAKKVYDNEGRMQRFDVRGWITVSQEFDVKQVLLGLLRETGAPLNQIGNENIEYHQEGEQLHKYMSGRRFFVVIDDIWSLEAWNRIKLFLPDNNNGSRVMITTRKVFGEESCPPELEEVGKVVAKKCRGLPLSIVVIGGVLGKCVEREYWEYIADNISASVNSEESERCLKILYMSYNHLPIHLKPCFLYLGMYPEDHVIRVPELIKLWVAEGFLKPNKAKSLEDVAIGYLKDLIDRNLIFVYSVGRTGHVRSCKVHDLLRDLCLSEGKKKRFLYFTKVLKPIISQNFNSHRRLAVCRNMPYKEHSDVRFHDVHASILRSFISDFRLNSLPCSNVKLLRILKLGHSYFPEMISELVNSRYIEFGSQPYVDDPPFRSLVYPLWNLQTLIIKCGDLISLPAEIWDMSQLRHVMISKFTIDDPRVGKCDGGDNIVMENLQTLHGICDFRCTEEVLWKIPNLRKLRLFYFKDDIPSDYIKNLGRLTELKSLVCYSWAKNLSLSSEMEFSSSLKKLRLRIKDWNWEDIGEKVGLLPHLEVFHLEYEYGGEEWNLLEGRFSRLRYLSMRLSNLVRWTVDTNPFPCLEHLYLTSMKKLEEIPSEIGDIPTLQSITLSWLNDSASDSAEMILEEQRSLGNQDLLVTITKRPIPW